MKKNATSTQKMLNVWAIVLIIWSVYRAKFILPEWFDEFIAKPLVFIAPVFIYIAKFEKKEFFTAINWKLKSTIKDILFACAIGGVFFISAVLGNYVKNGNSLKISSSLLTADKILLTILVAFATGITEEILSRGFVLKRLYDESKNVLTSSFFASILFFFLHVPILFTNPKINGNLILFFMFTDMLLSMINSIIFLDKKNLTIPILIHAFYNLSIYFFT